MSCVIADLYQRLDSEKCRQWWVRRLHPAGGVCPDCGVSAVDASAARFGAGLAIECAGCGKRYTWRTGTLFEGRSTAEVRAIYLVAALSALRFSPSLIAQATGMSDDSVRRWQRRMNGAA